MGVGLLHEVRLFLEAIYMQQTDDHGYEPMGFIKHSNGQGLPPPWSADSPT
ncbi:hypothetical protein GCM10027185_58590 [Spirosoma pulveris]